MCHRNVKDKDIEVNAQYALDLMESALKSVDPSYVRAYLYRDKDGDAKIYDQVERCFAYELYHQLRSGSEHLRTNGKKIVINAEIPKKIYKNNSESKSDNNSDDNKYPDIVIHGGQDDHNNNNQLLVCEIKRNPYKLSNPSGSSLNEDTGRKPSKADIKKDLKKLERYLTNLLYEGQNGCFLSGCFIMTNTSIEDLQKVILEIKKVEEKNAIKKSSLQGSKGVKDDFDWQSIWNIASKITIFSYKEDGNHKPKVGKFRLDKVDEPIEVE